jgi:hypothetical protein
MSFIASLIMKAMMATKLAADPDNISPIIVAGYAPSHGSLSRVPAIAMRNDEKSIVVPNIPVSAINLFIFDCFFIEQI